MSDGAFLSLWGFGLLFVFLTIQWLYIGVRVLCDKIEGDRSRKEFAKKYGHRLR